MLVEELRELPVGARVMGEIPFTKRLTGLVDSMNDGPHFIRWADGYVTFPFGWVRDYDEYIAAHTELQPSRCSRIHLETLPDSTTPGDRQSLEPERAVTA